MAITGKHSLGQLLIQAGKIDEDQLQKALTIQKEKDVYIGVIFKELGYLDERELNRYISQQLKIPYLSLGHYDVDKTIMGLIPERIIRSKNFLPLFRLNNTLNIAVSDPLDASPINAARDETGLKIEPVIVTETEIENAIDLYYGISGFVDVNSSDDEVTDISDLFDETRIVELVDSIITQSQRYRCSDIHVEPRENDILYDLELMVACRISKPYPEIFILLLYPGSRLCQIWILLKHGDLRTDVFCSILPAAD